MTTSSETETHLDLPCTRASVFDPLAEIDPWISRCRCCNDLHALYLHNRPIAIFPASSLDVTSLNQLLFRLRQRHTKYGSMFVGQG